MTKNNYLSEEALELKASFYKWIKHPYVQTHLDAPVVDDDKLMFLVLMLKEKKLSKQEKKDYMLSILLVEAALDTHEEVSLYNINAERIKRKRQLTVLAGDYYSSLYYHLLADKRYLPMLKVLTRSIQEVNEHKMNMYQCESPSFESLCNDAAMLESSVLRKVAEHLEMPAWNKVALHFFLYKRLSTELTCFIDGGIPPLIKGILDDFVEHSLPLRKAETIKAIHICEGKLEAIRGEMLAICDKDLPSLSEPLRKRIEQLSDQVDECDEKVAEEG